MKIATKILMEFGSLSPLAGTCIMLPVPSLDIPPTNSNKELSLATSRQSLWLVSHLSCRILRLLGAMQLTLQSVIPCSLQIPTENLP